ncbi:hypothetical protein Q1695_009245 [Nippostrongylus brasiliensis]|nr:hypothetical protein Q1695_009245 [Nippostrongylus brasiliensis]
MLGYGRPEISCPAGVQLEESRFFSSLGNTYDERSTALNVLIEEREDWRKEMNKSLQVALRDVRNYVYGEKDGVYQWIKNSNTVDAPGPYIAKEHCYYSDCDAPEISQANQPIDLNYGEESAQQNQRTDS